MSSYSFFGATADDVLRRLPGDMAGTSHGVVESALADAETRVEAALPERVRRLLRRVEGEVLVAAATEGQLSAAVGLPAASNLVLYADFAGPYADRTAADAMDASAYELDGEGRVVEANVVTPTAQNLANVERDLRRAAEGIVSETPGDDAGLKLGLEMVARAYDPCISCSVHLTRLD